MESPLPRYKEEVEVDVAGPLDRVYWFQQVVFQDQFCPRFLLRLQGALSTLPPPIPVLDDEKSQDSYS